MQATLAGPFTLSLIYCRQSWLVGVPRTLLFSNFLYKGLYTVNSNHCCCQRFVARKIESSASGGNSIWPTPEKQIWITLARIAQRYPAVGRDQSVRRAGDCHRGQIHIARASVAPL